MNRDQLNAAGLRWGAAGGMCVVCRRRRAGPKGGYIPQPRDRRPAGVRCGWCYRRYLKKYFPEAAADLELQELSDRLLREAVRAARR
jgi:hypothetical protein